MAHPGSANEDNMDITLLLIAEVLILGAVFFVLLRCCPHLLSKKPRGESLETEPSPPPLDCEAAARRLLAAEPELSGLYERLGYSLHFEREGQELLAELKGMIQVSIPGLEAFRAALGSARSRIRAAAALREPSSVDRALADRADDPLLLAADAAGGEAQLLEVLGRDPVDQLLPVVEQMPFLRDGRIVWRTPMALDLLHKTAAEPERFLRRLRQLENWVRGAKIRRGKEAQEAVLDASGRLRKAVEQGAAYLVTPVKALEERYSDWYLQRRDPSIMARRRGLDALFLNLVRERHGAVAEPPPSPEEALEARNRMATLAAEYCDHAWMESPRLAGLLLAQLLAAEARRFPLPEGQTSSPRRLLHAVKDEVATGRFDVEETVRRLRHLEDAGCSVHSLAFKLLRHVAAAGNDHQAPAPALAAVGA